MSIKHNTPATPPHYSHRLHIRLSDLNHANHLGHDRYLGLISEARNQLYLQLGCTELKINSTLGTVIASLSAVYLAEGHAHDELQTDIWLTGIKPRSLVLHYKTFNIKTGQSIATAETTIVCFNYKTKKAAAWPKRFLQRVYKLYRI